MVVVRRWYLFLVCAISLQAVTWSVIGLLRNVLVAAGQAPVATIAFQIAVIIIGLPLFLVHWLWVQRLARREQVERESVLRHLYLYVMLAAFLAPALVNAYDLVTRLLTLMLGGRLPEFEFFGFSAQELILRNLIALIVLALLGLYHWRVISDDTAPPRGDASTVRRLFVLGFSAVGLTLTVLAALGLLRWILFQVSIGQVIDGAGTSATELAREVGRLVVGLPLWLVFWQWAQALFTGPGEEERESALRKLYLYLIVFVTALAAVTNTAFILAGLFRSLLGLPSGGDIRLPLSAVLVMAVAWGYHATILQRDAASAAEAPRQASIRRLYLYLVAAIGLATFLVGLGGEISVLIRSLVEQVFGDDLREELAWFSAALIAGLPVWVLPWRQAQLAATVTGPMGTEERRSVVRKIYLYFFLFIATMLVLSSLVYIVYRALSLLLGEPGTGNLLGALAQAIAFCLIGVGVWLYHGWALQGDNRLNRQALAQQLDATHVAVVDTADGRFGRALLDSLSRELPDLRLELVGLSPSAAAEFGTQDDEAAITSRLQEASLIVGPWDMVTVAGAVSPTAAAAVVSSPARKLLVPLRDAEWEWATVDRLSTGAIVEQTVRAVKQLAEGEEVKPARPLSAGGIIAIIILVLFLLPLFLLPILFFVSSF